MSAPQVVLKALDVASVSAEQRAYIERLEWGAFSAEALAAVDRELATAERDAPELVPSMPAERSYGLYLFASATSGRAAFIWDSRQRQAKHVRACMQDAQTGEPMRVVACCAEAAVDYPLQQGDRVFAELSRVRAYQLVRETLSRIERARPDRFAVLMQEFESLDSVVESATEEALECDEPDVVEVTSSMLTAITRVQHETVAAVEVRKRLGDVAVQYSDAIAPYMRHRFGTDWRGRSPLEAFTSLQVHERFDPIGTSLSAELWAEMFEDVEYRKLAQWSMDVVSQRLDGLYTLTFTSVWVGLDVSVFDERVRIGTVMTLDLIRRYDGPEVYRTKPVYMRHTQAQEVARDGWEAVRLRVETPQWQGLLTQTLEGLDALVLSGQAVSPDDATAFNLLDRLVAGTVTP